MQYFVQFDISGSEKIRSVEKPLDLIDPLNEDEIKEKADKIIEEADKESLRCLFDIKNIWLVRKERLR